MAQRVCGFSLLVLRKIEARGAHEVAVKALEICGGIFRHACAAGALDRDPTIGLRSALAPRPPVRHYPHVTEAELPTLLERIDGYSGNPETKIAIKLMIFTFLRAVELRWARWDEFDIDAREWRVPSDRMKGTQSQKASGIPHIVPLSRQTLALLEELRQYTGRYPLLFPGMKNRFVQAMSAETINKALKSLGFEGKQTGHGFRGLASTDEGNSGLIPVLTKSDVWAYENEYRLIAKEAAQRQQQMLTTTNSVLQLQPGTLIGIVLGCQCNEGHVLDLLERHGRDLRVRRAKRVQDRYALTLETIR